MKTFLTEMKGSTHLPLVEGARCHWEAHYQQSGSNYGFSFSVTPELPADIDDLHKMFVSSYKLMPHEFKREWQARAAMDVWEVFSKRQDFPYFLLDIVSPKQGATFWDKEHLFFYCLGGRGIRSIKKKEFDEKGVSLLFAMYEGLKTQQAPKRPQVGDIKSTPCVWFKSRQRRYARLEQEWDHLHDSWRFKSLSETLP